MHTDTKRYYAVLGISPDSSDETIRVAFRRRAKELHPDARSGDTSAFILLKHAYDTLTEPEARAAYDRACTPPPSYTPHSYAPAEPRRPSRPMSPPPPPPRSRSSGRRSGISLARYTIAFIIMAAISLGGVQIMISLTEEPPSVQTRSTARADASATPVSTPAAPLAERSSGPGSSKSGFWDPTSARSKAP